MINYTVFHQIKRGIEMEISKRICGEPKGDGCGKPIGATPYAVRFDDKLGNVIYHIECEAKLPPTRSAVVAAIASEITEKTFEEFVESAFNKHGNAIKAKHKKLLQMYSDITDEEIKEVAKRAFRR